MIAFGGTEPSPQVLLNPAYGSVVLGHPLSLAATLNQLQAIAPVPLLATADFEYGAGMRIAGATRFPRAMALGATGDERLAFEAGRITAIEGRAMGVHVNFAPVADVNNNPRNPVINTRSFGEDPARVGAMVAAYVKGLQQGGMLATLKHFPGHGDTEIDSHLGLPIIPHPRERFEAMELPPFRAGIAAGAAGAMVAHIELPALDPEKGPATFSRAVITDFLRARPGVPRPHRHRLDEDGRHHAHDAARRRRGEGGAGRRRSRARHARPGRGVHRDQGRGRGRTDRSRASRRVGAPRAGGQGAAGPAPHAHGGAARR